MPPSIHAHAHSDTACTRWPQDKDKDTDTDTDRVCNVHSVRQGDSAKQPELVPGHEHNTGGSGAHLCANQPEAAPLRRPQGLRHSNGSKYKRQAYNKDQACG